MQTSSKLCVFQKNQNVNLSMLKSEYHTTLTYVLYMYNVDEIYSSYHTFIGNYKKGVS